MGSVPNSRRPGHHPTRHESPSRRQSVRKARGLIRIGRSGASFSTSLSRCESKATRTKGGTMWWGIGFGAFLYLFALLTLGFNTLRKGHGWMFFFGIFVPLFWLVG